MTKNHNNNIKIIDTKDATGDMMGEDLKESEMNALDAIFSRTRMKIGQTV